MKKLLLALLLLPSLLLGQITGKVILNKPTGYTIPLDSIQGSSSYSLFNLYQTTAGQTFAVPNMTSGAKIIYISNIGTQSVMMSPGGYLPHSATLLYRWTGSAWSSTIVTDTSLLVHKRTGNVLFKFANSNQYELTTDNGGYAEAWSFGNSGTHQIGFGNQYIQMDNGEINVQCDNIITIEAQDALGLTGHHGIYFNADPTYDIKLSANSSYSAGLKTTNLTANRNFEFPDQSGTIALTGSVNLKLDTSLSSGKFWIGQPYGGAAAETPSLNSGAGSFSLSNAGVITFPDASGSGRGFLNSTDWNTFNNKASTTSPTFTTPVLGVASATSLGITGTGGNGYINLINQSSAPATPASGVSLYHATAGLSWINTGGFTRSLTMPSANVTYTFPATTETLAGLGTAQTFTANQTFSGQILAADGTTSLPGYGFSSESGLGFRRSATNTMQFVVSGNAKMLINSAGVSMSAALNFADGTNITGGGTSVGCKFFTNTTAKLAFWNTAPISQPTTSVASSTLTSNGGTTLTSTDTFDGYTLLQIVKALRLLGLLQ
jgi:hypothetical protein